MGLETRKKVAEQFRAGFWKGNKVAELWADEFFPLKAEKPEKKEKSKKSE